MTKAIDPQPQGELIFQYKTKIRSILFFLAVYLLVPLALAMPNLYTFFPFCLILLPPLILFLSTFTKRIAVNDEEIRLESAFKVIDKTFRWERVTEACAVTITYQTQGGGLASMGEVAPVVRFLVGRGPSYVLKVYVDGAQPIAILPGEVQRYDELYDFINNKVKIRKA